MTISEAVILVYGFMSGAVTTAFLIGIDWKKLFGIPKRRDEK